MRKLGHQQRQKGLILLGLLLEAVPPSRSQAPEKQPGGASARMLIARIVAANGAALTPNTVDTLKAGDMDTILTGIATTFMDTYEVLQKAVAAGDNLIITHEPTFSNHVDNPTYPSERSSRSRQARVYPSAPPGRVAFSRRLASSTAGGILAGEVAELGWNSYQAPPASTGNLHLFRLPATTVAQLAAVLREKLGHPGCASSAIQRPRSPMLLLCPVRPASSSRQRCSNGAMCRC